MDYLKKIRQETNVETINTMEFPFGNQVIPIAVKYNKEENHIFVEGPKFFAQQIAQTIGIILQREKERQERQTHSESHHGIPRNNHLVDDECQ